MRLLSNRRVAIIGAGPAGLTLARLIHQQGVKVNVYERDASSLARSQGGSLDLHEDSGQLALKEAGLFAQFKSLSRPEGQQSRVFDKHGTICATLSADDEASTRPEIDRGVLRSHCC